MRKPSSDGKQVLFMQGSQAAAEAAIAAGLKFYAGYPITPATEIMEHLARELPKHGGILLQMEDEIAAIAAVIGASWTGAKAMTATSGPGFSLMQENIGYSYLTETPLVIVDVQRVGPSTGQATKCAQGDVMQARWGTHGDYTAVALSPNSVQEMYELTVKAFNLSEQYRTPVIVLADEITAHMRENVVIPERDELQIFNRKKPRPEDRMFFGGDALVPPMPSVGDGYNVAVTGSSHDEYGIRQTADPVAHRRLVERLRRKIEENAEQIIETEKHGPTECDIGVVSYGCISRSVYDAATLVEKKKLKVGHLRLKTLWPFPERLVREMAENTDVIIVPEMNLKQIFYEVQRTVKGEAKVVGVNKVGGGEMITPEELAKAMVEAVQP